MENPHKYDASTVRAQLISRIGERWQSLFALPSTNVPADASTKINAIVAGRRLRFALSKARGKLLDGFGPCLGWVDVGAAVASANDVFVTQVVPSAKAIGCPPNKYFCPASNPNQQVADGVFAMWEGELFKPQERDIFALMRGIAIAINNPAGDATGHEVLKKLRRFAFNLEDNSTLEAIGAAVEYVQIFAKPLPAHVDSHDSNYATANAEADNVFKKQNDTWTIRFHGGEIERGLKDRKAKEDIHYLLARPHMDIDILHLPNNRVPFLENATEEGVAAQHRGAPVATSDDCLRILLQLELSREKAAREQDPLVRQEIELITAALEQQLSSVAGKSGRPRTLATEVRKRVDSTQRRITREIAILPPTLKILANHLRKSISIGTTCQYAPDADFHWDLGNKD